MRVKIPKMTVHIMSCGDGHGYYCQAMEYDLGAYGATPGKAVEAFDRAVIRHTLNAVFHHKPPFKCLEQNPDSYVTHERHIEVQIRVGEPHVTP